MPLFVLLVGICAVAMLIPAAVALAEEGFRTARSFFYSALLFGILTLVVGMATQGIKPYGTARSHLAGLVAAYALLPVVLAVPFVDAIGNTRFYNGYFEMVSCLTTTGATLFDPARLGDALHLWRALVGWMGGLLVWVTAAAVMAPLNLGGFEVSSETRAGDVPGSAAQMQAAAPTVRLRKALRHLAPTYLLLTGLLWLLQLVAGEGDLAALIHAMSVMSTSGISPDGTLSGGQGGFVAELFIFVFFLFALTRHSFADRLRIDTPRLLVQDRELLLALSLVFLLTALLFVRHWIGALEVNDVDNGQAAFAALWGTLFTAMSFLTTTGFVSDFWIEARSWSGLPTPGLVLLGLALIGGGAATTAGGIKLIRVYALYKHGARELGKLTYPNSVAAGGRLGRRIRREGAYIAWVFFMLFILSMAAVMVALSLAGLGFEPAFVLSAASLSTTGPLAAFGGGQPIIYGALGDAAKGVLAAAMILGRLETLVLIALFNPGFWRI
ncbi:potassium transporter TrkG [Nioella nitratireducens]|uniref:potassium transporter TrkG n=1 Tax=Nioella nitratireducens TaxID=1287720 RepID=UPI001F462039|nr:potassium transporter TrkG [Nioella nitratireducens]